MDTKREKAMDAIFNEKGSVHQSYQDGWLKALENYDKVLKVKRKNIELKIY